MNRKNFKLIHLVEDDDQFVLERYETTFKTYEEIHKELERIVEKVLREYDPDITRTVLQDSINEFKYLDEINVSNLYPNIRIHTYLISI